MKSFKEIFDLLEEKEEGGRLVGVAWTEDDSVKVRFATDTKDDEVASYLLEAVNLSIKKHKEDCGSGGSENLEKELVEASAGAALAAIGDCIALYDIIKKLMAKEELNEDEMGKILRIGIKIKLMDGFLEEALGESKDSKDIDLSKFVGKLQ